jgi:uncharacterized protein (TIGR03437 family)
VDGRTNWFSYNFPWGIGETHAIEAPMQQTDDQGRLWNFSSWSQGGSAAQSFTVPSDADGSGVRLVATYTPLARLLIKGTVAGLTVDVDGTSCRVPCDIQREVGATVTVTTPASLTMADGVRADFTGWPGTGSASPVWSGTLGAAVVNLNATYRMMNKLVTGATPPEGVRWKLDPTSSDGYYEVATPVAVSVAAQPGYKFRSFAGDLSGSTPSGIVSMTSPRSVTAMLDRVPYIPPAGVSNAAGTTPVQAVAPGSVVSIFGVNLATDLVTGADSPLAQTLGGVTVRLGDRFLPLFFVSPSQINFQAPSDLGEGTQLLTVSSPGLADVRAPFTVVRNAPGLFPQAFHESGAAVTPDSPAHQGELLTLYGTGFGPTDRPRPEGFAVPASPVLSIVDPVHVTVGDGAVDANSAYAAAGRVGVDIVKFRLRDDAPAGTGIAVTVNVNGQDSNTITIPIQ